MPSDLFTPDNILPLPPHNFPRRSRVRPLPPREGTRGVPGARPPGVGRAAAAPGEGRRAGRGDVYAAPRSFLRRPHAPRLPRLTSLKLCDFLLRFLSENSMVRAGAGGRGCGRGRPAGRPRERRPRRRRRRRRWLLSPGSGSARTKVRAWNPQGGGRGKGKASSEPSGAAARGARREAPSREKLPPPGGRPRRAQRAPRPPLLPGACAGAAGANFPLGSELGAGRARRGGPGLPAPWAQLRTRRRRRRARPRGRGGRRRGASRVGALTAPAGGGAPRRRRRRRDPGATCWRRAAAAIPGGPGRRYPPAWPRGAPRRSRRPRAAPSARPAGLAPGTRARPGAGVGESGRCFPGARLAAPSSPAPPRRSLGPILLETALGVGDPPGQPTPCLQIRGVEGPGSLVLGKF